MVNLASFDLNLLTTLEALLSERSVTRAARKVGRSQPATSNALGRLRTALGDPLLVRTKGGMVPTARGMAIGKATSQLLRAVERELAAQAFEPTTSDRTFTIGTSDYAAVVLLPEVLRRLREVAPGVSLRVTMLKPDLGLADLESGSLDLTIGFFRKAPEGLRQQSLITDRFVLVGRYQHPELLRKLTLRDLTTLRQVQVAPHGEVRGLLDAALAAKGLARRVVVSVPTFLLALPAIRADLVSVLPARLAEVLRESTPLAVAAMPVTLPPITLAAYWHPRAHDDPGHRWLREMLLAAATGGEKPSRRPRKQTT